MTANDSQDLVRLEDTIAETRLVAMIRQKPAELQMTYMLEFRSGFNDFDYLSFATLSLPLGDRLGLIRHDNSPAPGTEICVRPDAENVPAVIQQAIAEMNLAIEDLTWIHPEYEQYINQSKGFEYKVISGEEYKKGLQIKVIAIEKGELLEAIA